MSDSNVEESRLDAAKAALAPDLSPTIWETSLAPNDSALLLGDRLWASETGINQRDDRSLYWRRLVALKQLRERGEEPLALKEFEHRSRGMLGNPFSGATTYRVLVTGFDPFHLDDHIEQGNPSGAIALAHQGKLLTLGQTSAEIRSMIFPVRYADFDEFLVERVLEPLMDQLDMIITVSMGRTDFDLERFPGLRRSVTTPDNERREGGGSMHKPVAPPHLIGPEFVEFSLPVDAMTKAKGEFEINNNAQVTTLEAGEISANGLAEIETQTAVLGSGGGYLSNEISYRVLRHLKERDIKIPAGHIHTPRIEGYDPQLLQKITHQCSDLIAAAISTLQSPR